MTLDAEARPVKRPFERPAPTVTGPNRRAGGFYRIADNGGETLAGVPLTSAEAAVVAAVRLGYKVAASQIDRSARLARRLRDASDRAAGPASERQALDATERLIFDSMMTGLEWIEALAAEPTSPLRRFASAEYRLLRSLLGLAPSRTARRRDKMAPEAKEAQGAAAARTPATSPPPLRIVLMGGERRAVRVNSWEIESNVGPAELPLIFYCTQQIEAAPLEGQLVTGTTPSVLRVTTFQRNPPGPWRAPICKPDGEQVGIIEIML